MLVLNHKHLALTELPEEFKQGGLNFLHDALLQGQTLEQIDKIYVGLVLEHVHGNKKEACRILDINYRTLQRKLGE